MTVTFFSNPQLVQFFHFKILVMQRETMSRYRKVKRLQKMNARASIGLIYKVWGFLPPLQSVF